MLFSRPKLPQLGWDLQAMPVTDDGIYYSAQTTDGRYVWFSYDNWCLRVLEGKNYDKEIFSTGDMHSYRLLPEQMCDILGVTVQGKKVAPTQEQIDEECGMVDDLSGATTYWRSFHRFLPNGLELFIQKMFHGIPNTFLMFHDWDKHRYYPLPTEGEHGDRVVLGIEPDRGKLDSFFATSDVRNTEFQTRLPFALVIKLSERDEYAGLTFTVWAECKTDNIVGMNAMEKMQILLNQFLASYPK